ncbi:MAG: prepilin-type N-terminal cleavage/methylation domain-containing protein [Chloroflexi bacterium]|nr:prepilin-type N-terminal cleavage/methylation domain-containing protein [Chloroflexota bacterium]
MMQRLRKIIKNQVGFTLIELMIALAITGIVTGACTMLIFQVFDGEARSNNHMDAISRVQNVGRQVSRDAGMAQRVEETNDEDGFPLYLSWTEWEDNETHEVVYSIEDNKLIREYSSDEGDVTYTFEYIISIDPDTGELKTFCERDPTTNQLTFTLTATAGAGSQRISETREYKTVPRPSL